MGPGQEASAGICAEAGSRRQLSPLPPVLRLGWGLLSGEFASYQGPLPHQPAGWLLGSSILGLPWNVRRDQLCSPAINCAWDGSGFSNCRRPQTCASRAWPLSTSTVLTPCRGGLSLQGNPGHLLAGNLTDPVCSEVGSAELSAQAPGSSKKRQRGRGLGAAEPKWGVRQGATEKERP